MGLEGTSGNGFVTDGACDLLAAVFPEGWGITSGSTLVGSGGRVDGEEVGEDIHLFGLGGVGLQAHTVEEVSEFLDSVLEPSPVGGSDEAIIGIESS